MGAKLTNPAEILFRQIHPDLMQDGVPASSGFRPSESDKDMLSVDRSSLTSPSAAHTLYTANGLASEAVFGVSVGEFQDNGLPCQEDPIVASAGTAANPAHALASFVGHTVSKQKTLAKKIKRVAVARGVLHLSPPVESA